ncbi:MAG: PTS system mannose/fructose/sorbose family transporter subunit IID [Bifidobacteriaceae bacterium]|nr:PTS system mannose/fructose/sorbose family transporter subunit IID [Bifidobacteriaceae bacterium]
MAYNIPENYSDRTPAPPLDNGTLNRMIWRSLFLQASFNYERMQAAGWLYGILPGLTKIHTNKDDLAASMSHNMEFFNTHPFLVNFVMGIVLSLEQNKAEIPTIRAVRVAAMGPLGGIGDALFWFTLVPITAGITSNMAINAETSLGSAVAAPFIFLAVFNIVQFVVRFILMRWSYKFGTEAIGMLTKNAKEFTRAASILGVFVVGALTCVYGGTKLGLELPNGETNTPIETAIIVENTTLNTPVADGGYKEELYALDDNGQIKKDADGKDELLPGASIRPLGSELSEIVHLEKAPVTINIQEILDGVLPSIIPFALTLCLYLLLAKKQWTPIACICLILAIGILGALPAAFGGMSIWP